MKQKNRIFAVLLIVALVFFIVGCAKCVSTEYENVKVTIADKHYRAMWLQPIKVGKSTTFITHPAVWEITVKYNGVEYTIEDKDTYNKYEDKIGQTTIGELKIETYDDGTVEYNIVSLE